MPLSLQQLQSYCNYKATDSSRCRYLGQDDNDSSVYFCLKKSPKKKEIDEEASETIKDMKKRGVDPSKGNSPLGDNCEGFPILRYIKQGFDQE